MKRDGAQNGQVSQAFRNRLNKVMANLNQHMTEEHLAHMTGPITLEMNMTQGMINTAYLMPKRKIDIE